MSEFTIKSKQYERALAYVQEKHRRQVRAGDVPVWHHLVRTAATIKSALEISGEGDHAAHEAMVVAALGHDLIEDTTATESEMRDIFGAEACSMIRAVTNTWGDAVHDPYVAQVIAASEEARLIKLADMYDNVASVSYNFRLLGVEWANSYFLPIVIPMRDALMASPFTTYARASGILKASVRIAFALFDEEVAAAQKSASV